MILSGIPLIMSLDECVGRLVWNCDDDDRERRSIDEIGHLIVHVVQTPYSIKHYQIRVKSIVVYSELC